MKSRVSWKWTLGLALLVLPLASGCLEQASGSPEGSVEPGQLRTNASVSAGAPTNPAVAAAAEATMPAAALSDAPVTPVSTERPLPPGIRPSSPAAEVIQLANSGVEEGVMLSFVTNSPNTFNLGADGIIYLQDIGIPPAVVTAMIQRDQVLKEQTTAAAPAPLAPEPAPYPTAESAAPTPTEAPPLPADQGAQVAEAAPPPDDASYGFYDTLAPYGTWVDVGGYGRCWQPTVVVVSPAWRPYWNCGRWVYSDCGWYWHSDYSWGWGPFHYGRWFNHNRLGWCWAPDRVWGPSWVCWRYSNAHCGWAPLPPAACYRPGGGFTYHGRSVSVSFGFGLGVSSFGFVPLGNVHDRQVARYGLPTAQVNHIYSSTIVSSAVFGNRNRIVNVGVPREWVASAARTPIHPVTLRDTTPAGGIHVERFGDNNRTLSVFRPGLPVTTGGRTAAVPFPGSSHGLQTGAGHTAPLSVRPAGQAQSSGRPAAPYARPGASLATANSTGIPGAQSTQPGWQQNTARTPRPTRDGSAQTQTGQGASSVQPGPFGSAQIPQTTASSSTTRRTGTLPSPDRSRPGVNSHPFASQNSPPTAPAGTQPQRPPTSTHTPSASLARPQASPYSPTPSAQFQRPTASPGPNASLVRPQASPYSPMPSAQVQRPAASPASGLNASPPHTQPRESAHRPDASSYARNADNSVRPTAPAAQPYSAPAYQAPVSRSAPAEAHSRSPGIAPSAPSRPSAPVIESRPAATPSAPAPSYSTSGSQSSSGRGQHR